MEITLSDLRQIKIALPPGPEQLRIASTLSDIEDHLMALDRELAKKRNVKQAAMQELLTGKRRLPGFEGEWEVKRLGDVAPLQRGFDLPNPKLEDGPYPVVYSNGVMNHHAAFQVKGPGVVTGRSGTIGKVHYVANDFWPHNTSLWVTNFRGNDPKFIFCLLSSMGIERFASGSGVPTLNRNDLHDQSIRIPSETREQIAIAAVLTDLDTNLDASNQQLAKAKLLKQGMMQQLLTGKIRMT
jgi:type I restriction enzyme S subunit